MSSADYTPNVGTQASVSITQIPPRLECSVVHAKAVPYLAILFDLAGCFNVSCLLLPCRDGYFVHSLSHGCRTKLA